MKVKNKDELKNIVSKFHDIIIQNKDFYFERGSCSGYDYQKFPYDLCHSTSELLKKMLYEVYELEFSCVEVSYWRWQHVFLENSNFIIDITAYQFNMPEFDDFEHVKNFDQIIVLWNCERDKYYFNQFQREQYNESFLANTKMKDYILFYEKLINDYEKLINDYENNNLLPQIDW